MSNERKWQPSGKCFAPDCPMTLVTKYTGDRCICWMHVLIMGLPITREELAGVPRVE